jgi:hypothetical protein
MSYAYLFKYIIIGDTGSYSPLFDSRMFLLVGSRIRAAAKAAAGICLAAPCARGS